MLVAVLTTTERHANFLAGLSRDAVLSHRSAAAVWGLWIPMWDGLEITCAATHRGSSFTTAVQRRRVITHRRILPPHEVTTHHGLPVTSLERTWLDLAVHLDLLDLVAAGDSALRSGADPVVLGERLAGAASTRGVRAARAAHALLDGRSRSRPESRMRAAIVLAGLPAPEVNRPVHDEHGQWLAEPDLHYREAKLALEYNGADHAAVERMQKDATRELDLYRAEWRVLVYTAPQVFGRIHEVVDDVRRELSRRAPHLLAHRLRRRVTTGRRE